jgi:hypothetical protein
MKIPFVSTFKQAQMLLKELNKRASKNVTKTYWVEPYQNGREHGYCLAGGEKRVTFSENRNSDSIVVYVGGKYDFGMQGNTPSEVVYQNRKFFDFEDYKAAADYILPILEASAEKWVKELAEYKQKAKEVLTPARIR